MSRLDGAPACHLHSLPAPNVAPPWAAATCVGSSDSSLLILNFTSLYDISVAAGHAVCVSVNRITGYQDVMLFCEPAGTQPTAESPLPNSPQAKHTGKRRCKVELLRDGEEDCSLLLSPLSYGTPSPFSPPPSVLTPPMPP